MRTLREALKPSLLFGQPGLKKKDTVSYEAKELDQKLETLFAEMRKKDSSDYEPDSLRVMLACLDCHLKEAGSSISISKDRKFVNSRKVFEGKARFLHEQGYGKPPHASKAQTTEDEELLCFKELLGNQQHFGVARNATTCLWKVFHSVTTTAWYKQQRIGIPTALTPSRIVWLFKRRLKAG